MSAPASGRDQLQMPAPAVSHRLSIVPTADTRDRVITAAQLDALLALVQHASRPA